MNKYTKISFIICFLLLFVGQAYAAIIEIVPSVGIGDYKLNTPRKSLKLSEKPSIVKVLPNGYIVEKYDSLGLIVQYKQSDGLIKFIGISKKCTSKGLSYTSKNGIKIGLTKQDAQLKLGEPSSIVSVTSHDLYPDSDILAIYGAKGLSLHYDSNDKIVWIIVFDPTIFSK